MAEYRNRPLVYLAGPYSKPDPVENTHRVILEANKLLDDGRVTPHVPHLTHLWHLVSPRPIEFWYEYDLALLVRCDAVLRMPGDSTGADREVDVAEELRIPVFHSRESLYQWIEQAN